jgi:group I intron endonuclease
MTDRYQNGKVYKLVSDLTSKIYVGSTCCPLRIRLNKHKNNAKMYPDRKVYRKFNRVGWDSVSIILLEEYPCDNKMQLIARERHWYDLLQPKLNNNVPAQTQTESIQKWQADNKEQIKQYKLEWKQQNPNYYKEYQKIRFDCECGKNILKCNKAAHCKTKSHLNSLKQNNRYSVADALASR